MFPHVPWFLSIIFAGCFYNHCVSSQKEAQLAMRLRLGGSFSSGGLQLVLLWLPAMWHELQKCDICRCDALSTNRRRTDVLHRPENMDGRDPYESKNSDNMWWLSFSIFLGAWGTTSTICWSWVQVVGSRVLQEIAGVRFPSHWSMRPPGRLQSCHLVPGRAWEQSVLFGLFFIII